MACRRIKSYVLALRLVRGGGGASAATELRFDSADGDYIGQGQRQTFAAPAHIITADRIGKRFLIDLGDAGFPMIVSSWSTNWTTHLHEISTHR